MISVRHNVTAFHRAFEHPIRTRPTTDVPEAELRLRARLITEEYFETMAAMFGYGAKGNLDVAKQYVRYVVEKFAVSVDLAEFVDGLADLSYVVEGSFLTVGVNSDFVHAEVHRANMAKLGPDGKPIWREDGKTLKPEGWTPPDIAGAIEAQRRGVVRPIGFDPQGHLDREVLGAVVRDEWILWANEQSNPKPSWLTPWSGLSESDREVDRRIGETVFRIGFHAGEDEWQTRYWQLLERHEMLRTRVAKTSGLFTEAADVIEQSCDLIEDACDDAEEDAYVNRELAAKLRRVAAEGLVE